MTHQRDAAAFDGLKLSTCPEKRSGCPDTGQKQFEKQVA
jgi:hypothetical protein